MVVPGMIVIRHLSPVLIDTPTRINTRGPRDIELETIFVPSEIAASRQPEFQTMSAEVDETQWQ